MDPLVVALKGEKQSLRVSAAKVLVGMYRLRKLSDAHERSILANRDLIVEKHSDGVSTEECLRVHTDTGGVGVDFPL